MLLLVTLLLSAVVLGNAALVYDKKRRAEIAESALAKQRKKGKAFMKEVKNNRKLEKLKENIVRYRQFLAINIMIFLQHMICLLKLSPVHLFCGYNELYITESYTFMFFI